MKQVFTAEVINSVFLVNTNIKYPNLYIRMCENDNKAPNNPKINNIDFSLIG